jgi:hypothetical protein
MVASCPLLEVKPTRGSLAEMSESDPLQTLAAAPTAFPRKEDQERIRQSESEDNVEQVEQKREFSTERRTGPEKSKRSGVGE